MNWKSILGAVAKIAPIALSAIPGVGPALGIGKGLTSILGTAGQVGSALSPVLSSMAGAKAKANEQTEVNQIPRDQLNQNAAIANNKLPGSRLSTAAKASYANAGPVTFSGLPAPGFGQRGQAPVFSGGGNTPLDPRVKQLSNSVMDQELNNQLTGADKVPGATAPPPASMADKLLSGGADVTSLMGAVGSMNKPAAPPVPGVNVNPGSTGPDIGDPNYIMNLLKKPTPLAGSNGAILNPSLMHF